MACVVVATKLLKMSKPKLPSDLLQFLRENRRLVYDPSRCECGSVSLVQWGQLTIKEFYVDSEGTPLAVLDPHKGETGYYAVPGLDLIGACKSYDPEGILIWLPDLNLYGTWDSDRWDLLTFPGATWTEIAADPVKYLNAQWFPQQANCELLVPWPTYPFRQGRPWNSRSHTEE